MFDYVTIPVKIVFSRPQLGKLEKNTMIKTESGSVPPPLPPLQRKREVQKYSEKKLRSLDKMIQERTKVHVRGAKKYPPPIIKIPSEKVKN